MSDPAVDQQGADESGGDDGEVLATLRRMEPWIRTLAEEQARLRTMGARLEVRADAGDARLGRLETRLDTVAEKVDRVSGTLRELNGRVVQLPTLIQILTLFLAVNGITVAVGFSLARLLAP